MKVILLLGLVTVVACQTPELDTKPFACTADSQCGEGYFCGAGRCVPVGTELCDGTNPDAVECDVPAIIIEAGETATHESGLSVTLTVRLSTRPNANVGLDLRVSDSTEARLTPETYLVEPGTWDTPMTLTVTGLDDAEPDGSVAYQVKVSATSQDTRFNGLVGQVDLVNHDDDTPDLLVDVLSSETTEAGGEAKVSVRLATQPIRAVVVRAVSSDPTEGRESGDLQFDNDTWFTPQVVTVVGVDDGERDGDTNYELVLTATGVPEYEGLTKSIPLLSRDGVCGNGVIDGAEVCDGANADACTSFGPTPSEQRCVECACGGPAVVLRASGELEEGGSRVTLSARLRTAPEASVELNFSVRQSTEARIVGSALNFSASDWSSVKQIEVEASDNERAEGAREITIDVSMTTNDPVYKTVPLDSVKLTLVDNDTQGFYLNLVSGFEATTTETGGLTKFRAGLLSEPMGTVEVAFKLEPGSPALVPESHTFSRDDWEEFEFELKGTDNRTVGPISYNMTMERSGGTAPEYVGVDPQVVRIDSVDGVCGNDVIDGEELCDGEPPESCADKGWRVGTIDCVDSCRRIEEKCGYGFVGVASTAFGGCAIDRNRKLKCWGHGQGLVPLVGSSEVVTEVVGSMRRLDPTNSISSANDASLCALLEDGRVICLHESPPVESRFRRISLGVGTFSFKTGCGIRTDGTLTCWGPQLSANPPAGSDFIDVSVGDSIACAIKASGPPICWGQSPPSGTNNGPFVQVIASRGVCARRQDGTVWCSDRAVVGNYLALSRIPERIFGLRSNGTVIDVAEPGTSWGNGLVSLGGACAVQGDGEVQCWHTSEAWPSGRPVQAVLVRDNMTVLRAGRAFRLLARGQFISDAPAIDDVERLVGKGSLLARRSGGVYDTSQSGQMILGLTGQVLRWAGGANTCHSCWLLSDSSLHCGSCGVITPPDTDEGFVDLADGTCCGRGFVGITEGGDIWRWGSWTRIPVPSSFALPVTAVSVSRDGLAACYKFSNNSVSCVHELNGSVTAYPPPLNTNFWRVVVDHSRPCFIGIRNGQLVSWGPSCSGLALPAGTGFVDVGLDIGRGYALKNDGTLVPIGSVPALPE